MADFSHLPPYGFHYLPADRWPIGGQPACRRVDAGNCRRAGELLAAIGRSLAFPAWYGANFDALHDCLSDPACLPAGVLLISGLDTLAAAAPGDFATLLEVLASAAKVRRQSGSALLILIDSSTAGLPPLPTA